MFECTIETDNATFHPSRGMELARILRQIAERLEREDDPAWHVAVFDANGNTVGHYSVKD